MASFSQPQEPGIQVYTVFISYNSNAEHETAAAMRAALAIATAVLSLAFASAHTTFYQDASFLELVSMTLFLHHTSFSIDKS